METSRYKETGVIDWPYSRIGLFEFSKAFIQTRAAFSIKKRKPAGILVSQSSQYVATQANQTPTRAYIKQREGYSLLIIRWKEDRSFVWQIRPEKRFRRKPNAFNKMTDVSSRITSHAESTDDICQRESYNYIVTMMYVHIGRQSSWQTHSHAASFPRELLLVEISLTTSAS